MVLTLLLPVGSRQVSLSLVLCTTTFFYLNFHVLKGEDHAWKHALSFSVVSLLSNWPRYSNHRS